MRNFGTFKFNLFNLFNLCIKAELVLIKIPILNVKTVPKNCLINGIYSEARCLLFI